MISTELKSCFTKARILGNGQGKVSLTEAEIAWLLYLTARDLNIEILNMFLSEPVEVPGFYEATIPPVLPAIWERFETNSLLEIFNDMCACKADSRLYFSNLCAIFKRRTKFQLILSSQAKPTMDQIGPRSLLEYGVMPSELLGNWMLWRKWIFDIDNRSGQETGYLFEPVLASCMGGVAVSSQRSPVKRINREGEVASGGRQIDCLDVDARIAYEFKLRVSIAASGQGRFSEELSFPSECRAAGLKPVLIVLDPTPSNRLTELVDAFKSAEGTVHIDDAWEFIESQAGECMSIFIEKYLRPVLSKMASFDDHPPTPLMLKWNKNDIVISSENDSFHIERFMAKDDTVGNS